MRTPKHGWRSLKKGLLAKRFDPVVQRKEIKLKHKASFVSVEAGRFTILGTGVLLLLTIVTVSYTHLTLPTKRIV